MNEHRSVKVSVFLPEHLHRQLKLQSVQRGTSLQKVISAAAEDAMRSREALAPKDSIDALSLVSRPSPGTAQASIDTRTIKAWQSRLKRILESGNRLAILNCTASIEAMAVLINEQTSHEFSGVGLQENLSIPANQRQT